MKYEIRKCDEMGHDYHFGYCNTVDEVAEFYNMYSRNYPGWHFYDVKVPEPVKDKKEMKRICFTYHMSKPNETVESCITLPIPEDVAPEILAKGSESKFLGSNSVITNIFTNLACLQGYCFNDVVTVEEEKVTLATEIEKTILRGKYGNNC